MISFGILAIAMPFMTVLPTIETRTLFLFFSRKNGEIFLQQFSLMNLKGWKW